LIHEVSHERQGRGLQGPGLSITLTSSPVGLNPTLKAFPKFVQIFLPKLEVRWKIYGNPEDAIVDPYPKEGTMRYPKVKSIFSFLSTDQFFRNKEAIL